jgi:excisionase family DNA binding protein
MGKLKWQTGVPSDATSAPEAGYLTMKQLAGYTSLSATTLRKLLPEIPHIRIRRKILVKRTDFDYWARRRQRLHQTMKPIVKRLLDELTA